MTDGDEFGHIFRRMDLENFPPVPNFGKPTMVEDFVSTPDGNQAYQQERAILEVLRLVRHTMKEQGVNQTELAKRIGVSRSRVSRILKSRSPEIRTIANIMAALGKSLHFSVGSITIIA